VSARAGAPRAARGQCLALAGRWRSVPTKAALGEPAAVVVVVDDVVVIVVAVVAVVLVVSTTVVLVVVLGGQGGGAPQFPGPTSTPPAVAQSVGDSTMHVRNAPPGDVGRQHCVVGSVVVVVVATNVVLVVVVVTITVVVVVVGGHGFGVQLPGPASSPPALVQSVGERTMQVRKAPPGDVGRQHCVVGSVVVVVLAPHSSQHEVRVLTVPPFATHCCADLAIRQFVLPPQSRKLVQEVAALFVHFPIAVSHDPNCGRSHTTASAFFRPQSERAAQSTNASVQEDETSVGASFDTQETYPPWFENPSHGQSASSCDCTAHRSAVQSCWAATIPGRTSQTTARMTAARTDAVANAQERSRMTVTSDPFRRRINGARSRDDHRPGGPAPRSAVRALTLSRDRARAGPGRCTGTARVRPT